MTPQRRLPPTPALAALTRDERATVLALLASHPDLLTEAEQLALAVLGTDTIEGFADNVAWARGAIELKDLAARSGRVRGRGYVHENEAAWELLTEARPLRSRPSPTNHARSPRLGQRHCNRHRGGPLPIAGTPRTAPSPPMPGPTPIAELVDQASATRKNSASRSRRTPPRATGPTGPSPAESGRPSAHRTLHGIDGSGQSNDREPVKELDCGHRRLAQRGGLVIDDRGYSFGIGMDQLQHEVVR